MSPAFYKRFHVFVFREICVSRGGPQPHSPQHQAREAWEFSHFPKALARLVLRHAATARKTAPLQKLKRSLASVRCEALWLLPGAGGESLDRLPTGKGHVLGRERGPRRRRPAGPARKIHTPPPSLDPSGLIQTLTARSTQSTRSPPLTPPYNAPKLLADTSLDRRHIAGIAARSPAEHANSNPGCARQALCAAAPRATAPQSHAPSLAAAPSRAMHAPHCLQLMAAEG